MMLCFEWQLSEEGKSSPHVKNGQLDMTENWGLRTLLEVSMNDICVLLGLTIMPRHYGEMGLIKAVPRQAASLAHPQRGDD